MDNLLVFMDKFEGNFIFSLAPALSARYDKRTLF